MCSCTPATNAEFEEKLAFIKDIITSWVGFKACISWQNKGLKERVIWNWICNIEVKVLHIREDPTTWHIKHLRVIEEVRQSCQVSPECSPLDMTFNHVLLPQWRTKNLPEKWGTVSVSYFCCFTTLGEFKPLKCWLCPRCTSIHLFIDRGEIPSSLCFYRLNIPAFSDFH